MKQKQTGFTITELLVVVVVIGILAAVVLPKFTKTLENYKAAEAEHMLEAVRNEQEARCELDGSYTADPGELGTWATDTSKYFNYSLQACGMSATRLGGAGYMLQIPLYEDGRICCEGCDTLNKDYLSCDELRSSLSSECPCAAEGGTPPPPPGGGSEEGGCSTPKPADVACGCTGHKEYVCDTASGTWQLGETCIGDNPSACGSTPTGSTDCCSADFKGNFNTCLKEKYGSSSPEYVCATGSAYECGVKVFGGGSLSAACTKGQGAHSDCPACWARPEFATFAGGGYHRYACNGAPNPCEPSTASGEDDGKSKCTYAPETVTTKNLTIYTNNVGNGCEQARASIYGKNWTDELCEHQGVSEGDQSLYTGKTKRCIVDFEIECRGNAEANHFFCYADTSVGEHASTGAPGYAVSCDSTTQYLTCKGDSAHNH